MHIRPSRTDFFSQNLHDLNDLNDLNNSNDNDDEDMLENDDIHTNSSSDEEGENGLVTNQSGLFFPDDDSDIYGDERYYPGGQFDVNGDTFEFETGQHQISRRGKEQAIGVYSS